MDTSSNESDSIDWNTEDELEIDSIPSPPSHQKQNPELASSSSCSYSSSSISYRFLLMGFPKELVIKAVNENGENEEAVLDALLTYKNLEESPKEEHVLDDPCHAEPARNVLDVSSDEEICEIEENTNPSIEKDSKMCILLEMGFGVSEASAAIDKYGIDTPIPKLLELITDALHEEQSHEKELRCHQQQKLNGPDSMSRNKRKLSENEVWKLQKQLKNLEKQPLDHDNMTLHLPNPMIGFGVPNEPLPAIQRSIPDEAKGRPYFYFENVAQTPRGVWHIMSKFLYEIQPEFVDSKFLCAAARKRGYIHNLPIDNRFQILPIPPSTIHEAFPHTREFWPSWDTRTKMNCLLTSTGGSKLTERIKKALEESGDEPSLDVKKHVLQQCKRWNLIWVGRNKAASLEPDEMEMLMGFPQNHTRGGGITRREQFTVLGNAFQVDTVAYHLSALKSVFPDGINVLSLFSGIGGAEVALHRLGIRLKNVVSVEKSEACRVILASWWQQTNQQGNLIHFHDIRMITEDQLVEWMSIFGGFDLIIGGSPCNNFAGCNRLSRSGLEGVESSLFYEYYRITKLVRLMMRL